MSYNSSYLTAAQLTARARNQYDTLTSRMPLSSFFPSQTSQTFDFAFERKVVGFEDQAEFREFSASNALGKDRPVAEITGRIPPIGRDYELSEYAQVQLMSEGTQEAAIQEKLQRYAELGADAIARRLELARVDAVLNGKVTLAENNVYATIDYGRDPSLVKDESAAPWSNTSSDPVGLLEQWIEDVRLLTGTVPVNLLVSRDVFEALRVNDNVRNGVFAGMSSVGARATRTQVQDYLADELGIVQVIDMTREYAVNELDLGTPWPDGYAVLTGAAGQSFGFTQFGVTAFSTDSKYGIQASERAGIFSHCYDEPNIPGLWVGVNAVALPVMPGVNTVVGGKVMA